MSNSCVSLYIPVISQNISEAYIKKMFINKNIGKISRVDFVKNLAKNRCEAFIHFEEWFDNEDSNNLQKDVLDPSTKTQFKFNNTNRYWPLLVNKNSDKKVDNPNYKKIEAG